MSRNYNILKRFTNLVSTSGEKWINRQILFIGNRFHVTKLNKSLNCNSSRILNWIILSNFTLHYNVKTRNLSYSGLQQNTAGRIKNWRRQHWYGAQQCNRKRICSVEKNYPCFLLLKIFFVAKKLILLLSLLGLSASPNSVSLFACIECRNSIPW